MNRSTSTLLLAISLVVAHGPTAAAIDWIGPNLGSWTTSGNWNPSLGDPLNVVGPIDIVATSTALNRCNLDASGFTANVSGTVLVQGYTGASIDNQQLHLQHTTTLAAGDYVIVAANGMIIVDSGSTVHAPVEVLVDGTSEDGSLYLRNGTLRTPLLENWGLVQAEFTSTFEHPVPFTGIDVNNYFPGVFRAECGADVTVDGDLYNAGGSQKAEVRVGDGANLVVTGTFTNNGILTVGADCDQQVAQFTTIGLAYGGTTAELFVRSNGVLACAQFDCATVDSAYGPDATGGYGRLDLGDGEIRIDDASGGAFSTMELLCEDVGADVLLPGPDAPPGAIGTVRLAATSSPVRLVDDRDNTRQGAPEVIYVRALILEPGVTVDLNGGTIYYGTITPEDPFDPESGVTVIGEGSLVALSPVTAVVGAAAAPPADRLHLQAAAPNPFRGASGTTLRFSTSGAAHVTVHVHDAAGRVVRRLLDTNLPAGEHRVAWDGRAESGAPVAGGVYFYAVDGLGERKANRIVLLP